MALRLYEAFGSFVRHKINRTIKKYQRTYFSNSIWFLGVGQILFSLDAAMEYLHKVLEVTGGAKVRKDDQVFRSQIAQIGMTHALKKISGTHCHHYPICIRKILFDDTLVSMASPSCRNMDSTDGNLNVFANSFHEVCQNCLGCDRIGANSVC